MDACRSDGISATTTGSVNNNRKCSHEAFCGCMLWQPKWCIWNQWLKRVQQRVVLTEPLSMCMLQVFNHGFLIMCYWSKQTRTHVWLMRLLLSVQFTSINLSDASRGIGRMMLTNSLAMASNKLSCKDLFGCME